jgi:DNA primase
VVNFDPDTAGAAATERSLAALIEEDFNVRVVGLEQGLDPDMFIRQRGVDAYKDAIKQSRKYFHYLIDRAQQQFPGKSPEAKVKQVNYLLPHIQRVPNRIARDELSTEVAQRLDIDSGVLRQELKSAAASRSQQVSERAMGTVKLTNLERDLIVVLSEPSHPEHHRVKETLLAENLHEGWSAYRLLDRLVRASDEELQNPIDLLEESDRSLFAFAMTDSNYREPTSEDISVDIGRMRRIPLERDMQKLLIQIDSAARVKNDQESLRLSAELTRVKKALNELGRTKPDAS